jgi:hypothetical protein
MAQVLYAFSSAARTRLTRSKVATVALLAVLVLLVAAPAAARGTKKHTPGPAQVPSDAGYVAALAIANRFLYAWQMGDLETGMVLLSDQIRHAQNPEKLENLFTATTNRSYEIGRGSGNHSRYSFPVVLIRLSGSSVRRRNSQIVVIRTGKNDWVVDKLP